MWLCLGAWAATVFVRVALGDLFNLGCLVLVGMLLAMMSAHLLRRRVSRAGD